MQSVFQEVLSLCNLFLNRRFSELSSQRYSQLSMEEKKKILEQLRFHKLYAILRSNIISELLETNEDKTYLHGNELLMAQNMHWKELTSIVNCLSNQRINYLLVKGVRLSWLMYSNPYTRGIGDIDLVIQLKDYEKAFNALISNGYVRGQAQYLKNSMAFYGIHYHEVKLYKMTPNGKVRVEVKKRTSATNSFELWWHHVIQKTINGLTLNVLEDNFEILHLILNAFVNNESFSVFQDCRLRDYFDVAYAIKYVNFSWQVVLDAAEDMKVTHQIAAVLRSVKELFSAVGEQADEVLSIIEKKYCKYEQTLFYYGMDKFESSNYGLVENRPRADMSYSMFDRDFSTYQWNKSYRAVLYSKKNPDYLKRVFLFPNESTVSYSYRNEAGINANYRFFRREKEFIVEVNIEHTCKEVFKNNRCNIDVTWYNSDINSPTIYLKTHSPEIHNLETIDWDKYVDGEQCIGYYSGAEYARIMDAEAKIPAHITSGQEGNITRVFFSFDKDQLFYPLDVLLLEVKFVFAIAGDEEDILIDQGTVEHFIECVDHRK